MAKSRYFKFYNANPFGKALPDCAIRSTSLGLNIPYAEVCKRLHCRFKDGQGLVRDTGVDLYKIQDTFDKYFEEVENFDSELNRPPEFDDFVDPFYDTGEFEDISNQPTLEEWIEQYEGTGPYLVSLDSPKRDSGHLVYVCTNTPCFYDTWDCSKLHVDAFMRIKGIRDNEATKNYR